MGGISILAVLLLAIAPIWRVAGSKDGYSAWEAARKHIQEVKHIKAEEAVERARVAYRLASVTP